MLKNTRLHDFIPIRGNAYIFLIALHMVFFKITVTEIQNFTFKPLESKTKQIQLSRSTQFVATKCPESYG